ncbi:hypothetical protein [Celeribacter sp.]|uniref:hypothetical protein n=1 Tax=Celeribacter sp. TaxID=1890673 RepID=UPI003A8E9D9B
MAIFTRRRIQAMLNDLTRVLDEQKRSDIVNRLEDKKVEQSLPAEMELALTWLMKDFESLEIEPEWWQEKKPDIFVDDLLPGKSTAIEIKTVADNKISGEREMDHCSRALIEIANEVERGIGEYLYFHFTERRVKDDKRRIVMREITAPSNYTPSEDTKRNVSQWIARKPAKGSRLPIDDNGLLVTIEKCDFKCTRFHNVHSPRPPRIYSDTRNPIYSQLKEGLKKFKTAPEDCYNVIFLADGGSQTLSKLAEKYQSPNLEPHSTANDIINRFVADAEGRVDAVVVFIPIKQFRSGFLQRPGYDKKWGVVVFGFNNELNQDLFRKLEKLAENLPNPRYTALQARSLTRQGAMKHDSRGHYLSTKFEWINHEMTCKISSRVFHEFLAGKIDEERFRYLIGEQNSGSILKKHLENGYTIRATRFEPGGIDEDDDYIVLEFDQFQKDPAASKFS